MWKVHSLPKWAATTRLLLYPIFSRASGFSKEYGISHLFCMQNFLILKEYVLPFHIIMVVLAKIIKQGKEEKLSRLERKK